MRIIKYPRVAILVMSVAIAVLLCSERIRPAHAAQEPVPEDGVGETTAKDQVDLAVTVYNSNTALVRDVRQISLPTGDFPLRFEDVAASIDPATVHLRSLSDAGHLMVVEQNYEFDLLDPQKLLQKYVGREITLVQNTHENGSTKWLETKALLLADNNGPVWKIGDQIVTGMHADSYRFPDLPENLYSRPTLVWALENKGPKSQRLEASYLANGINWSADYVLSVTRDEKSADLDGWVTLVNNSGTAYRNARLQLVAGALHQISSARSMAMDKVTAAAQAPAPNQFEQEAFSEYHLYSLGHRTSIGNNESKQISLLGGTNIPVEKHLLVEAQPFYYRSSQGIGNAIPQTVKVIYRFRNDEKSGLGMPLPAGTVRVYQADSRGGVQFAGEDHINHTAKDEDVNIYIGDAFDVVARRKETDFRKIASNVYEMEYQITLRNHKETAVTVEVREPVGGDWEVLNSDYKWTKLDSSTIGFQMPVDKDGEATLDYRVRVHW